ncbi:hypothetical protein, partial [Caballeronia ptereochthonis]|uniref:hypothetical protein n=1 Tax=Caballeronia ptereochthonis TaxID=1777144 RepID=UPI001ABF8E1A
VDATKNECEGAGIHVLISRPAVVTGGSTQRRKTMIVSVPNRQTKTEKSENSPREKEGASPERGAKGPQRF